MDSLAPSPAQDIEALDRGVREAGLMAARALAEVEALREGLRRLTAVLGAVPVPAPPARGHLRLLPPA